MSTILSRYKGESLRQWEAEDEYHVTGRGRVFSGKMPDPVLTLGECIHVIGIVDIIGTVFGIERYMSLNDGDPGQPIGVLLTTPEAAQDILVGLQAWIEQL